MPRLSGPLIALKLGAVVFLLSAAALLGARPPSTMRFADSTKALVRRSAEPWCQRYAPRSDLHVVAVEVRFQEQPKMFAQGEGVVVAPLAIDLTGTQRVLEVDAYPTPVRRITVEDVTTVAWEYPGRLNRNLRFLAVALVESHELTPHTIAPRPTFSGLVPHVREEALLRAKDLEEHQLHTCAAFPEWALKVAGAPPHTDQLARIAHEVAAHLIDERNNAWTPSENLCTAIQVRRFTPHQGQVIVAMAAREAGVPAFAFASASPHRLFLVGTYTDEDGWVFLDLRDVESGFFSGGGVLITRAPLIGGYPAGQHDLWYPQAAAYRDNGSGGLSAFSQTAWAASLGPGERGATDTTEATALALSEVCR